MKIPNLKTPNLKKCLWCKRQPEAQHNIVIKRESTVDEHWIICTNYFCWSTSPRGFHAAMNAVKRVDTKCEASQIWNDRMDFDKAKISRWWEK